MKLENNLEDELDQFYQLQFRRVRSVLSHSNHVPHVFFFFSACVIRVILTHPSNVMRINNQQFLSAFIRIAGQNRDSNANVRAEKKLEACEVGRKSLKQAPCHTHSPLKYNGDQLLGQQEKGLKWTSHMSAKETTTCQTPKSNIETKSQEKKIYFVSQTTLGRLKSVQIYLIDHNCSLENNFLCKLSFTKKKTNLT